MSSTPTFIESLLTAWPRTNSLLSLGLYAEQTYFPPHPENQPLAILDLSREIVDPT
ncbi:orotidine-5'-phosphate decarboxylase, partial [Burkholderia pseudomallei]